MLDVTQDFFSFSPSLKVSVFFRGTRSFRFLLQFHNLRVERLRWKEQNAGEESNSEKKVGDLAVIFALSEELEVRRES